jgi:hypothetical protein
VPQCSHRGPFVATNPKHASIALSKTEVGPIKYISDDRVMGPRVTAFGLARIFRVFR